MNRRQRLVQEQFLDREEAIIKRLNSVYAQSLKDINAKVKKLEFNIKGLTEQYDWMDDDDPEKAKVKSKIQSKIYQKQYQEQLQKQVDGILNQLQEKQYTNIAEYLDECYSDGFVGTIFDMHGQDVPLMMPIDQESMVRAVQTDSKISNGLYSRLGEDVNLLKRKITAQVSRAISTGMTYAQTAQQLAGYTKIGMNNSKRIVRTEGHRIQCTAAMDACYQAKERGADVVKQWSAFLDDRTRESHWNIHHQIREIEEPFSNGLMFPGDPSGRPEEVINCRCALLQRARWAVGGSFTEFNGFTKQIEEFESPESYDEFKKAFFSKENRSYMTHVENMQKKYKTKDFRKVLDAMDDREYKRYSNLLESNPVYNAKSERERQYGVMYGDKAVAVDLKYISSPEYESKFSTLTTNAKVNKSVCETAKEILEHCNGTDYEDLYLINTADGSIFAKVTDSGRKSGIIYSDEFKSKLVEVKEQGVSVLGIHNHPQGTPPSPNDFRKAHDNGYTFGLVVGHNGQVYRYETPTDGLSVAVSEAMDRDLGVFLAGGMDVDRAFELVYNGNGLKYTILEGSET